VFAGSLRRLQTAARIQLAADNREASIRRGGSELAEDVVLYAGLHELAAEFADGREDSAHHGGCGSRAMVWPVVAAKIAVRVEVAVIYDVWNLRMRNR